MRTITYAATHGHPLGVDIIALQDKKRYKPKYVKRQGKPGIGYNCKVGNHACCYKNSCTCTLCNHQSFR